MTELSPTLTLMAWLSPAFPTGGFAYSAGLESAVARGLVDTALDLKAWLEASLTSGSLWNDAVIIAAAWHDNAQTSELAELASALALGPSRLDETLDQGAAFARAAQAWLPDISALPLAVALGLAARRAAIPLNLTLGAYLQAGTTAQIQAVQRLGRLGQQAGVDLLAALIPLIERQASRAEASSLDDLGSSMIAADLAALGHDQLETRIFRS